MYSSPSLRYDSSHQEFSMRESDEDNMEISLEAERSYLKPTPGFGTTGQKTGFCNPFHEDRKVSQEGREFAPSSVTFEWLRQAESASLYGESEDYTRPVLHPVRSWGPREVVREQPFSVIHEFDSWRKSPELAEAVAAIKALTAVIKRSEASTMMGLEVELKMASDALKASDESSISLSAGCDLFMRYVTRTSAIEYEDIEAGKARLIERGERFGEISQKARRTIAELGKDFITDGSTILTHGYSRVVLALLKLAALEGKDFNVICTEGRPDNTGAEMAKELVPAGIPVTLILDSGVAYMMETVDMVLVGADGVVESGGIINMLGTYQTALVAYSLKKPVYVAAESYKFARLYPLDQRDMSPAPRHVDFLVPIPQTVNVENSARDYTPPQYLTLLFTDLGILTPSAGCEGQQYNIDETMKDVFVVGFGYWPGRALKKSVSVF